MRNHLRVGTFGNSGIHLERYLAAQMASPSGKEEPKPDRILVVGANIKEKHTHYECSVSIGPVSYTLEITGDFPEQFNKKFNKSMMKCNFYANAIPYSPSPQSFNTGKRCFIESIDSIALAN